MPQLRTPAAFMRGGTSKALVFHRRDLPADPAAWDGFFLATMGSPDPHGRQLDGMGGGVTSLSKVCVVGPPSRGDADIDYSFFQVLVREARVSAFGNCGNMSAAMGPFAVDEGLVTAAGPLATVRIHNTNTGKIVRATFAVEAGRALTSGDCRIPGVAGSGAAVRLDFLDPGGAGTGRLLPTGRPLDLLQVDGLGQVEVSIVDAANPCVFVAARSVGLAGTELPEVLEDSDALARLHAIGQQAVGLMGLGHVFAAARKKLPLLAVVSAPKEAPTLSGERLAAAGMDLCVRMLSNGQPHRALPMTGAVCTVVAMHLPGTLPHRLARAPLASGGVRRLAMPSGVVGVDATVVERDGQPHAEYATVQRTARRLFDGFVYTSARAITDDRRAGEPME
ncbi:MAG: PrpF domain-containing protein [Pseudomonadota bacterium]